MTVLIQITNLNHKLGRIKYNEYNSLTWIVGVKHFAVVINGEVRYCGHGTLTLQGETDEKGRCNDHTE